jgi:hypothetical protein
MVFKDHIVEKMVKVVEDLNTLAMRQSGLPEIQIKQMNEQARPQLHMIQGEVYEFLFSQNIIRRDV